MDTNNEKARHGFVTFLLWASIAVNAFLVLFFPYLLGLGGIVFIVVIVGNILILNWRIIGVFILCAIAIIILLIRIFYLGFMSYHFELFGVIALSIYFAILNIRKDGISVWKQLLDEARSGEREAKIWDARILGAIILLLAITVFPITRLYDNIIVMFAPLRIMFFWHGFDGRVLGNHVLKTEYGEIRIGHLASVTISDDSFYIQSKNFRNGKASHRLVLSGAELPEHLDVQFSRSQSKIIFFDLNHQDIHIYGIPVRAQRIHMPLPDHNYSGNILSYSEVRFLQENITLSDSTEVNLIAATLSIYKDEQRWVLRAPRQWFDASELRVQERPTWYEPSIFVRQHGETEVAEYRSITFKPNWGEFIEGVPLEE